MRCYEYRMVDQDGHVAEPEDLWMRFLEVLTERGDLSAKRKILGDNPTRFFGLG